MTLEIEGYRYNVEEDELFKWDYGISKENGKHAVKFIWLEEYKTDEKNKSVERCCHLLECSSRGIITFDGKKILSKEATILFQSQIFGK